MEKLPKSNAQQLLIKFYDDFLEKKQDPSPPPLKEVDMDSLDVLFSQKVGLLMFNFKAGGERWGFQVKGDFNYEKV